LRTDLHNFEVLTVFPFRLDQLSHDIHPLEIGAGGDGFVGRKDVPGRRAFDRARPDRGREFVEQVEDRGDDLDEPVRVHRVPDELADREQRRVLLPPARVLELVRAHDEERDRALALLPERVRVDLLVCVLHDPQPQREALLEVEEHAERLPERERLPELLDDVPVRARTGLAEFEELGERGEPLESGTEQDRLLVDPGRGRGRFVEEQTRRG